MFLRLRLLSVGRRCGSVVVDSLFNESGSFVFGPCFVMHHLASFIVLQSSGLK